MRLLWSHLFRHVLIVLSAFLCPSASSGFERSRSHHWIAVQCKAVVCGREFFEVLLLRSLSRGQWGLFQLMAYKEKYGELPRYGTPIDFEGEQKEAYEKVIITKHVWLFLCALFTYYPLLLSINSSLIIEAIYNEVWIWSATDDQERDSSCSDSVRQVSAIIRPTCGRRAAALFHELLSTDAIFFY